jgi:hypothetical protein
MLWEGYLLRNRREFLLAFHGAPFSERLKWKYQGRNLLLNGWLVVAIISLIAGCNFNEVFVVPALCAVNAVLFLGNQRAVREFRLASQNRILAAERSHRKRPAAHAQC